MGSQSRQQKSRDEGIVLSKSMKLSLVLLMPFCFVVRLFLYWIDMPSGASFTPLQIKRSAILAVLLPASVWLGQYFGQTGRKHSKPTE